MVTRNHNGLNIQLHTSIAEIKISYDVKYPGRFYKTIKVFSNTQRGIFVLKIKGEVKLSEGNNKKGKRTGSRPIAKQLASCSATFPNYERR
ncbi:MAG: hypothetical protein COC06_09895 [Bacteroidales bacterium]|nr:MAG: hypothetical protein COC06_09895 [Bacteroidales bacterium]